MTNFSLALEKVGSYKRAFTVFKAYSQNKNSENFVKMLTRFNDAIPDTSYVLLVT